MATSSSAFSSLSPLTNDNLISWSINSSLVFKFTDCRSSNLVLMSLR
ncbi:unnamed protein product [Plutella xylostella]|uniref:(diamondback moth) hypothetical protein n=1 Tax=Plutella xylostella TaxID=51655 RepID=A0A8S4DXQ0_PLUXY|nr:unnamed protein product [Plutella xylostella]